MDKFGTNRSFPKAVEISTAVSTDLTNTGVFLTLAQPNWVWGRRKIVPAPRTLEDLHHLLDSFCQHVWRRHVNLGRSINILMGSRQSVYLGDANDDWYAEG